MIYIYIIVGKIDENRIPLSKTRRRGRIRRRSGWVGVSIPSFWVMRICELKGFRADW